MLILGLNISHSDSSACLVLDGILISAISEERLGDRVKNNPSFPINAISRLLNVAKLNITDIDFVTIAGDPKKNNFARLKYGIKFPISFIKDGYKKLHSVKNTQSIKNYLASKFSIDKKFLKFEIVRIEHHIAHIASSYFCSNFEKKTLGFSYDASGDFTSMMVASCEGNKITPVYREFLPNSLGYFYTAMCQFIGFDRFGEEFKVMGLAPYGEDLFREEMRKIINLPQDKFFNLDAKLILTKKDNNLHNISDGIIYVPKLFDAKIENLLGPPRLRHEKLDKRYIDIAKSTQIRFEEAAIHAIKKAFSLVDSKSIAMAGGCALNGVTNARLLRDLPIENQYIQPASSDDGTAIGSALYFWHHVLDNERGFQMAHAYWGTSYKDSDYKKIAEDSNFFIKKASSDDELVKITSKYILEGNVVGWFQGKCEWGPRALGNRSILANPLIENMKETINKKIKRRESFRPFAPSVLKESVSKYFEQNIESPFMMHVVKFKPKYRNMFPSVVHVDGTGRLQSVDKKNNKLYYNLIKRFEMDSGHGILLNTSFNENEPIVEHPRQAFNTFERTDMDVLVLGKYIFKKNI